MKDIHDKVMSIQAKILEVQSRQRMYEDHKLRDMTFQTGENFLIKVSPMKGLMWFGKKRKLCLLYFGPFEILKCVVSVAY